MHLLLFQATNPAAVLSSWREQKTCMIQVLGQYAEYRARAECFWHFLMDTIMLHHKSVLEFFFQGNCPGVSCEKVSGLEIM